MLHVRAWNLPPPSYCYKFNRGTFKEETNKCTDLIDSHFFNHLVSIVIPERYSIPLDIKDTLNDCDYYSVKDLPLSGLICKEFIEAFVKKGHLTVLSHGTCIDTDDSAALTPSGHLVLSLNKESFQQLGLEGKPSFFCKRDPQKYVVQLDLKEEHFTPGKKKYERVQKCLNENLKLKMNFLVAWDPPEEKICPSSVAAYFSERGYVVALCKPKLLQQVAYNIKAPLIPQDGDDLSMLELTEWLGAFSIGADLEPTNSYINSYTCPLEMKDVGAMMHLKCTGYFTYNQIHNLFDKLREYVAGHDMLPWISIYVQGFSDSPVSWNLKEHQYYTDGDNNYVIFLKPNGDYSSCSYLSSNKRPRHKFK